MDPKSTLTLIHSHTFFVQNHYHFLPKLAPPITQTIPALKPMSTQSNIQALMTFVYHIQKKRMSIPSLTTF